MKNCKIGIAQLRPVLFNKERCVDLINETIVKAGNLGVELLVFGESWLSGYPVFLDHCQNVAIWDDSVTKRTYRQMHVSAVDIRSDLGTIKETVREAGLFLCLGLNEKLGEGPGSGTIFNSAVMIDPNGDIVLHHRKLMPTFTERMIYGLGDGHGLRSVDSPFGRITVLICWEHWMPLTRQALHNAGEEIHIALWPQVLEKQQLASQHYAFEGRCFVVTAPSIMQTKDLPSGMVMKEGAEDPETYLLRGGASVIAPNAELLMKPVHDMEELLTFEIRDIESVLEERLTLDTSGHYQRPDIFDFHFNQNRIYP